MYNDWKIIEDIGEGGQAWVYKVSDKDGNYFALKRFKNPKRIKRINEEILNGKNMWVLGLSVPEILENGIDLKGHPYFVTNYFTKGNLKKAINTQLSDMSDKISFSILLCQRIHEINDSHYAHRDLKPENILIDNEDKPIICDLGLSHNLKREERLSLDGEPIGSTHYLHKLAFDTKSVNKDLHIAFDAYSFGKIFYEILLGEQLFGFERINVTDNPLKKIISDEYDEFLILKLTKIINRLLDDDLKVINDYWERFPSELEIVFSSIRPDIEVDDKLANQIGKQVSKLSDGIQEPTMATKTDFQLLIEEIESLVNNHPAINYCNELLEQHDREERVRIKKDVNIREILEGVGVKSHYGIDPIVLFGWKRDLILKEFLIELPTSNSNIGITVIDNNPKATIILFCIIKNKDRIDIDEDTIEHISVDPITIDTNQMINEISLFIEKTIGG